MTQPTTGERATDRAEHNCHKGCGAPPPPASRDDSDPPGREDSPTCHHRPALPDSLHPPGPGLRLLRHRPGAPALRRGFGPQLRPCDALGQLQHLLNAQSFWACGRSRADLRRMLRGSEAVVTAWRGCQLVGFGRACSDGVFRAVLWDVVVHSEERGQGLGRAVVQALLDTPPLRTVERVYLMTTNSSGFYLRMGFRVMADQHLMLRETAGSEGSRQARRSDGGEG